VWDWILIGVLYVLGMGFFHWLGGLASAAEAITDWSRRTSPKRRQKLGL
jgi:hypothetical protein